MSFELKSNVPEFKVQDCNEGFAGHKFEHGKKYESVPTSYKHCFKQISEKRESRPEAKEESKKKSQKKSIKENGAAEDKS